MRIIIIIRYLYNNNRYKYSIEVPHSMTDFPSIFVPLVGLVFPAIAMASLSLHVENNKIV
uniref:Photosystem I reaction center subunit VIII n=2 Tax=Onagroideae TaxID=1585427 RepID=A0AAU6MVY5_9MYRT|nr:photosystem I subunit VIII [Epilobium ulleungensis]YP_010280859.1 photosystem I subunit VIII [Epilobium minutiflorum]YP_010280944.1 photosystem I subunit VIII [Epilobium williamsii]YP_010281029.1 photosystem I subunit VIII [Epilobium amurense subsp. amurense]YP_010281199.1 photosystem I subunit VIII [Epilobium amurense subsp. cephalostigma]YP_010281284.1 photosystem I subunit VIII [Epilobium cylindricum]YP_010281537.1 photosystem I subunit VIII [Epilobium sikkimense]YP_010281876.1 photosy